MRNPMGFMNSATDFILKSVVIKQVDFKLRKFELLQILLSHMQI